MIFMGGKWRRRHSVKRAMTKLWKQNEYMAKSIKITRIVRRNKKTRSSIDWGYFSMFCNFHLSSKSLIVFFYYHDISENGRGGPVTLGRDNRRIFTLFSFPRFRSFPSYLHCCWHPWSFFETTFKTSLNKEDWGWGLLNKRSNQKSD